MASDLNVAEYVVEQMSGAGSITFKRMFGEFGIYCDGKIIGSVCDNHLFIKPTEAGRSFVGEITEASPYQGAKPQFLIEEKIDDAQWLSQLVKVTYGELPEPKAKRKPKRK